jgi:hypothetical protein
VVPEVVSEVNERTVANWIELAQYDLATARAMLRARRYLYVSQKGDTPPYTHNLVRLADSLSPKVQLGPEDRTLLTELNAYYIESRYSESLAALSEALDRHASLHILRGTERSHRWLTALMRS